MSRSVRGRVPGAGRGVRKHLENAYEKLGVHTRTGAVAALFARDPTAAAPAAPPSK